MRRLAAAAAVATAIASACGGGGAASGEDHLDAAVGVEAFGCSLVAASGSGAIVGAELVITSAHTVAGAREIDVVDGDDRSHRATLVRFDPDVDLAVLAVPGLGGRALELGRAEPDDDGWILAWNRTDHLHAIPMTVAKRIRVRIEDIYVEDIVERRALELAAEVGHGDSGAAVVTSTGDLVGVVYATSRERTVGFALDEREIADVVEGVGTTAVDPGPCT